MATCKDCLTCIEKCPKDEDMKNIAQGRMWATKELIEINKKIDSGVLVEVCRCAECKFATELDKHCEINRTIYKHCSLLRGDETRNVWHKYKKYYKDYSLVEADDYCSHGERRSDDEGV